MPSTLIVSLFLPCTVAFPEKTPKKECGRMKPFQTHQRATSSLILPSRASELTLLEKLLPASAPKDAVDEFFADHVDLKIRKLVEVKKTDSPPMPSESFAADWGNNSIYNQPRAHVAPLPPDGISAFDAYLERRSYHAERYPLRFPKRTANGPVLSKLQSRAPSSDRGFDDQEWKVVPPLHGNAGLVSAMRVKPGLAFDADIAWIGTIGFPVDSLSANLKDDIHDELQNEHQSHVVYCSDKDIDGHYKHYCKLVLWPIFHYQVPDHAKSKAFEDHSWDYYANVNRVFADQVVACYKKGDTIWIHDYHLLLVPRMVREKLPDAKIGFFLHAAFPSAEVFRCLAKRKELLEGMLGADLIGFQCKEYTEHFLSTCAQILLVETLSEGVQLEQHFVNVVSQPIGINPRLLEESRRQDEVKFWIDELSEKFKNKRIIFARDKLDNVHGVRQKLLAFETFLQTFPEMKEKVVMIQIATSANEQLELLVSVSDIVSRIESLYSSLSHQPLVFLRQDLTLPVYHAILSIADIVMISSLREGMCLTAHDYSFCQDGELSTKKHGAVILSEFTGSAAVLEARYPQKLQPTHVSINPWDNRGMSQAIKKALDLTAAEREARWRRLHDTVMNQTGAQWSQELQRTLDIVYEEHHQRASVAVPRLDVLDLIRKYTQAERHFFVIDYDGTLMPHRSSSGFQPGSPRRMLEVVFGLLVDPRNTIYIMSGRTPQQMESAFNSLPELGLIAENGGYIRSFGSRNGEWDAIVDENDVQAWKEHIMPILEYYRERLEDSTIEERLCSILFRYEKCKDQETAVRLASECAVQINGADKALQIRAVPVNKAVLIEMESFDKGKAAATAFKRLATTARRGRQSTLPPDFLMVAGDDREDEVVFRWANELGKAGTVPNVFTVTVGKRNTEAQATLDRGATSLLNVLDKLAKVSVDRALPFRSFYQQPNQLPRNFTFPV